MRINNNLMAMNTHRQLGLNSTNASRSIEKLSSGLRINKAGDDAAGLAISEKMRGQIRGLSQASRNAQDGISLIQTAEGALSETHDILQRMRELAVQSSTDTNTDQDRTEINNEISELKKEIDRIAGTTEFNTQKLLDGSKGASTTSADLTGGVAKTITSTSKLSFVDGTEVKNNVIDIRLVGGTNSSGLAGASGASVGVRLEIPEGKYDDVVSFTNALNTAYENKLDELEDAGIMSAAQVASAKAIDFKFDVTASGEIQFRVVDTTGALASGAKFEIEFDTLSSSVASAIGVNADFSLAAAATTSVSGAAASTTQVSFINGASAQWDEFALKLEDGIEQTANQNNQLSLTYDDLNVSSYVQEGDYASQASAALAMKNAIVGVESGTALNNLVSAPAAAQWTALVASAAEYGSGVVNIASGAAANSNQVTGLVGAVNAMTDDELKAKGYEGATDDMKAAYFRDLYNNGTKALTVGFDTDSTSDTYNKLQITAPAEMEIDETSKAAIQAGLTDVNTDLSNSGITYQIGANKDQTINVGISDMRTTAIGQTTIDSQSYKLSDVDVSTKEGAAKAISIIDTAIKNVSSERSKLGAVQNRLEHTIKNLDTSAENLQASESRIRDVDMAKEMMTYTKNNILQQAAQAMLAQANQAPQGVLQLLR